MYSVECVNCQVILWSKKVQDTCNFCIKFEKWQVGEICRTDYFANMKLTQIGFTWGNILLIWQFCQIIHVKSFPSEILVAQIDRFSCADVEEHPEHDKHEAKLRPKHSRMKSVLEPQRRKTETKPDTYNKDRIFVTSFAFCVITYEPIEVQTFSAPQNDRQNLVFVKDIKVVVEKMTRNRRKVIGKPGDSLLCRLHSIQLSSLVYSFLYE